MSCLICNRKVDVGELIKCKSCKSGYHYKCVNITSTAFKEGQLQLKRNFMCSSCSNITHRVRVTDDTPVRSGSDAHLMMEKEMQNRSLEESIKLQNKGHLTSDEMVDFVDLMNKINNDVLEKLNSFKTDILKEIRESITSLTQENGKLRQDLCEANKKCCLLEQQIITLKNENITNYCTNGVNHQDQRQQRASRVGRSNDGNLALSVPQPESQAQPSVLPALRASPSATATAVAAVAPPAAKSVTAYAAVASNPAGAVVNDGEWTEVNRNRRSKPIIRGGNSSIISLKAVERKKFLHVWRLDSSTTEDNLRDYLRNILDDDSEIIIEKLKPKTDREYSSFRIGVTVSNYDRLCVPEVWPVNVEVSEWIWFRRQSKPNQVQ
jgi:hypothetical protein